MQTGQEYMKREFHVADQYGLNVIVADASDGHDVQYFDTLVEWKRKEPSVTVKQASAQHGPALP
jgi:hypothetical protein